MKIREILGLTLDEKELDALRLFLEERSNTLVQELLYLHGIRDGIRAAKQFLSI